MEGLVCFILLATIVGLGAASDCCSSYTNPLTGQYVDGKVCPNYCCVQLSVDVYDCCDDASKQAPAAFRDSDCSAWIEEHIWVPIVCVILLILFIVVCTCCCCCACCGCCRKSPKPGVIITAQQPNSVVVMSSNQHQMLPQAESQNAAHYGYDQK